jgi:hypothetical protein
MVNTDRFYELLKRHGYGRNRWSDSDVKETGDLCSVTLRQLPVLPFFVDLANELGVSLERITAESEMEYGCPTCGGDNINFVIQFPRV